MSYLDQIKAANPDAYSQLSKLMGYTANDAYGGQAQDYQAQIFTPLKADAPKSLDIKTNPAVYGTTYDDMGFPIQYIKSGGEQILPEGVKAETGFDPDGNATITYTKDLGVINGLPVSAKYDASGNLTGYNADQRYRNFLDGSHSVGGAWDASGKPIPQQYSSGGGGFLGNALSDLAGGFGGYAPLLANLVLPGAGTALSLANAAVNGGDLSKALQNAAISQAIGQSGIGGDVAAATDSEALGRAATGAISGATNAALGGGDVLTGALTGGVNAGGNALINEAATNIGGSDNVTPVPPVNNGGSSIMGEGIGMSPEETAATDWAKIYAQPSTDPVTGETITGGDQSQYPVQDFGVPPPSTDIPLYSPGSTGFASTWQTVGSDRIMVQDDGTAIGMNENGDPYALDETQVQQMIDNGLLNSDTSGYTAAIKGTDSGTTIPTPGVNLAGLLSGAGGASSTAKSGTNTYDPITGQAQQAGKVTPGAEPGVLNPLLFSLAGFEMPKQSMKSPFSDVALGTSTQPPAEQPTQNFAQGGLASAHPAGEPQFYSEGGLNNRYIKGDGDGTSDSIPAMVADSEFVMPADVVAALGNGSSDAGASKLDQMVQQIRKRARSTAPDELPPTAHESPLDYLKGRA